MFVSVGARSRASGRMVNATVWEWRREAGGYTEESGRRASKVAMAWGSRPRRMLGTKARGLTDCRTVMAPRPTPTVVSRRLFAVMWLVDLSCMYVCLRLWPWLFHSASVFCCLHRKGFRNWESVVTNNSCHTKRTINIYILIILTEIDDAPQITAHKF